MIVIVNKAQYVVKSIRRRTMGMSMAYNHRRCEIALSLVYTSERTIIIAVSNVNRQVIPNCNCRVVKTARRTDSSSSNNTKQSLTTRVQFANRLIDVD